MGVSRPCHWLLAAVILSLSSSLMVSETLQLANLDPSTIDVRRDETNRTRGVAAIRRRRYVRFPTGSAAYLTDVGGGPPPLGRNLGPIARFVPPLPGTWRQHKSLWRSPVIADYNRPVMSHRTPRLIFRDNDFLSPIGGGGASFFQQSNQLPEFEDDVRGKSLFFFLVLIMRDYIYTFFNRFSFFLSSIRLKFKFNILLRLNWFIIRSSHYSCCKLCYSCCNLWIVALKTADPLLNLLGEL